jgi:hypothetical protein
MSYHSIQLHPVSFHQSSVVINNRIIKLKLFVFYKDRLCGLVVRVLGYRSRGPGSIPGTTSFSGGGGGRKTIVSLEQGPLSLVSTTEELLDRKVAAPV